MMKKLLLALLAMMLVTAGAFADGEALNIPEEILGHLERNYRGYTLEDYDEMPDSPKGDLALALVKNKKERVLVIYRERESGMIKWIETSKAIPQYENEGWISVMKKGQVWTDDLTGKDHVSDGLRFTVGVEDDNRETTQQSVTYQYEDGTFKLVAFRDQITWNCFIRDGYLEYWNLSSGDEGRVYGELEQNIAYLSYEKLPKTYREAKQSVTIAPELPTGTIFGSGGEKLKAKEIEFTGGRNYAVYTGPGEQYARSGKGKGTVSTNDWIQVFGRYDDYIMIQYDISADQYRIGWIKASALPGGASVPNIDLKMLKNDDYGLVYERCILTDDPFNSETAIATLEPGTPVCEIVFNMGGWSYVRVTIDGQTMCGFVPTNCISHG